MHNFPATAQKITGKWYGIGNVDILQNTNDYLCELILKQNGRTVTGEFNYYFRNGYFSNKLTGTYDDDARFFSVRFMPIMFYATINALDGIDCVMKGEYTLRISQAGTFLIGSFISDDLHKYTCAPIKVTFKKMPDDEPTLKEHLEELAQVPEDSLTAPEPEIPIQKITSYETERLVLKRSNKLIKILDVSDDSVRIDLYDNAEFDYDTISVFYNRKLVQLKQLLNTRTPISFYVKVDSVETNNDLVMFAENLGLIPPNAAIMIVTDKKHRYEVSLESNYSQNAAVRLRKIKLK